MKSHSAAWRESIVELMIESQFLNIFTSKEKKAMKVTREKN